MKGVYVPANAYSLPLALTKIVPWQLTNQIDDW
jgi:hypothetical protein